MDRKLLLLIVLGLLNYGANLWGTSIYILDEAKNAGCAMEMLQQHEAVIPTFNGELRTDKPPLHYFFMMGSFTVFGITPFAARFFSMIMGVMLIVFVYSMVKKIVGEMAGFFAALILVVSIQLSIQFHLAVPDPYLIFFFTAGLLCFYRGYQFNDRIYFYLFYIFIAACTLVKGPVAVVFSGMIVFIFLLVQRKLTFKELHRLKLVHGILIFCFLVLPWYLTVSIQTHGAWAEGFFIKHNVGRFTSTMEGHGGFPLASLGIVIAALMPFSFFGPQACVLAWRERKTNSFLLFCLIAMFVVIIFFAFSKTILPSYPEPALPFFAILLGVYFARQNPSNVSTSEKWSAGVYCAVACALPAVAWVALKEDPLLAHLSFTSAYFGVLTLSAGLSLWWICNGRRMRALGCYAVASVLFLQTCFYGVLPEIDEQNPVVKGMSFIKNDALPVVVYRNFNPAFVFALKRTLPKFDSIDELRHFAEQGGHGYIITQQSYLPELEAAGCTKVYEGKDLFETSITVILVK